MLTTSCHSVDKYIRVVLESYLVKEEILRRLRQAGYVSGQELGREANVSRTAVWKCISELRREGYHIEACTKRGYRLAGVPDNLFPEEIKSGLRTRVLGWDISYHRQAGSTQDIAKTLAIQGAVEGAIVIAERQDAGRGRIGRKWTWMPGGIYVSIILRPDMQPSEALRFPLVAGVAVAEAIKRVAELPVQLKWPNDILIRGRKAGGILTEMSAEVDRLDYVIIGIGLNVNAAGSEFPEEIKSIATSVRAEAGEKVSRVTLLQGILEELEQRYNEFQSVGFEPVRNRWRELSNVIGERVVISSPREQIEGLAEDIDWDGALIIKRDDGRLERIIAGDVSLRRLSNE